MVTDRSKFARRLLLGAMTAVVAVGSAGAQVANPPAVEPFKPNPEKSAPYFSKHDGPRQTAADYVEPEYFPKSRDDLVALYLSKARKAAEPDLFQDMAQRCILGPVHRTRINNAQYLGKMVPTRIFDQFYSIGQNAVMAFALKTSAGIILFDTLSSEDEARTLLLPNMVALGLDPKDIKLIILTHGHGDHYGGAEYIQRTYGARVYISPADWTLMEKSAASGAFRNLPLPASHIDIRDGDKITLGDTTVTAYITPGHTPGTIATIFPVTDHGKRHVVGFYGGMGGIDDIKLIRQQLASLDRWAALTKVAHVDVNITNHSMFNGEIEKQEILRYLLPGDTNPFVVGENGYQRYVSVISNCNKASLARKGEVP